MSLSDLAVSEIVGDFYVPAYQRGYRWGPVEVTHLLDDIEASKDDRYYLQPVVVKRMPDGRWELIDGQQRLTTLYLILLYIRRANLLPAAEIRYSLEYETRMDSKAYLENPVAELHETNIDFFHLYKAYEAIDTWFTDRGHRKLQAAIDFYTALSAKVRIIWYEAGADEDSATLFTRLNLGRIPLTDAELVKALLLSRSRTERGRGDRAQEMVAQWDGIERDLRVPEVWAFITGSPSDEPTHISLLLDTLAERDPAGAPLFHTFETLRDRVERTSTAQVWGEIVDLHALVLGWHDDRDLYHRIGYLIVTGTSFGDLVSFARDHTKREFAQGLDDRIRDQLRLTEAAVRELTYTDRNTEQVLLLMNVESVRRTQGSSERYSFRDHAAGAWSLEHIHAQNAERLNRAEQWVEWLHLHAEALADLPHLSPARREDLLRRIGEARESITEAKFRVLEQELLDVYSTSEEIGTTGVHSIANLALLDRGVNSALNNGFFEVKRRAIIAWDKAGAYIPVCTRNAFLRYYTAAEAQQAHFWSAQDREGYLDELVKRSCLPTCSRPKSRGIPGFWEMTGKSARPREQSDDRDRASRGLPHVLRGLAHRTPGPPVDHERANPPDPTGLHPGPTRTPG